MNPQEVQFLAIRIRRGHVLEDALNTIAARADELKKPLRIIFSSGACGAHGQEQVGAWMQCSPEFLFQASSTWEGLQASHRTSILSLPACHM